MSCKARWWERGTLQVLQINFSDRGGRTGSPGQDDLAEFRGSMSPLSLVSFHVSPFQLSRYHFFPINALTIITNTMQDWGFSLLYKSAIHKMTFYVWLTEIPAL